MFLLLVGSAKYALTAVVLILLLIQFFQRFVKNLMNIQPRHIRKCVIAMGLVSMMLVLAYVAFTLYRAATYSKIEPPLPQKVPTELPYAFKTSKEAYEAIGEPLLHLEQGFSLTKLPDIRNYFAFYGTSQRPDVADKDVRILVGIRNVFPPQAVAQGEKIYLKYNGPAAMHRWTFSDDNSETPIWIEPEYTEGHVTLHLKMKDSVGNIIDHPTEYADFTLPQTTLAPSQESVSGWTLGSENVDALYFQHVGARWYGTDVFLATYGRDDYPFADGAIRVEFQYPDPYAIYVKEGDVCVFDNDVWHTVQPGKDSLGKDLLHVTKITDTTISFDLWDKEGRHKIALALPKSPEIGLSPQMPDIKLVGARSRTYWIVEIQGKRTLVKSDDWFICINGKCEKITSVDFLDDYLRGAIQGELIVLSGSEKRNNSLVLVGERFCTSRTSSEPITIAMPNQNPASGMDKQEESLQRPPMQMHESDDDEESEREPDRNVPQEEKAHDNEDANEKI